MQLTTFAARLALPGLFLFSLTAAQAQSGKARPLPTTIQATYQTQTHFDAQYGAAAMQYAFAGADKKDVTAWRAAFLPRLKHALGLDKLQLQLAGYVPKAEKKESEDVGPFIREHWIIWTEPDVPLPISVLKPKNIQGKLPLVITPHGHGSNSWLYYGIYPATGEYDSDMTSGKSVSAQAVLQGYIAIAPTTRAFGATRTEQDKKDSVSFSCHAQLMKDLLAGRTPIGDRVWDMSRILDWALKNLPVDKKRVAITGNSGGGTVTLFTAAIDDRFTVAAPSSYFCTFKGSIGTISHCDCNYIPGILDLGEMADVAGLIAPRPLVVINGNQDPIFPFTETQKAFVQLKKIYTAAGTPDKVMLYEGNGGHQYYKEGSWPFIKKYFAQ